MTAPGKDDGPGGFGKKWSVEFGSYLTLGLQLALAVILFFFLGFFLDRLFDTSPWLTIIGFALGVTGGFVSFFRTAIALGKREDQRADERREQESTED